MRRISRKESRRPSGLSPAPDALRRPGAGRAGAPHRRRASAGGGARGRPPWIVPAACGLAALAMRLWAHAYQPYVTVDGTEYVRIAESLLEGQAFPSIFPPGYPALVALARLVVDDRLLAAASVSLVCGALLPVPVWWLARRAVGDRWAGLPTLAVALHPELARISSVALSEAAYFLPLYAGLALAARPLPAGLGLGAAFAIRPEGMLCAAGLALANLARHVRRTLAARALALFAAGFLLVAGPCWVYFRTTLGEWTVTPKLVALRAPDADWRAQEPRLAPEGSRRRYALIERLRREGPAAARAYPRQALGYGRLLLTLWPAPLLLLSLWGLARGRGAEVVALLPIVVLPFLGGLGLQSRLLLGALPALAILATRPLAGSRSASWRGTLAVAWVAGAAWCAVASAGEFRRPFDSYQEDQKDAGRWLAAPRPRRMSSWTASPTWPSMPTGPIA